MPGFLYFAELTTDPTIATVRELGLSYAFASAPASREVQGHTPSGNRGRVFGDSKRLGDLPKLDMDNQVWRKIPGKEVWVGYWKDAKPGPADLARAEQLAGFNIKMADGNEWLIPVVRAFDEDCGKAVPVLPALYGLDDDGKLTRGEIQAAHRWLWDLTEPAWQAMLNEGELTDQDCLDTACKVIGANYAVDVVELAGVLQVFSPQLSPAGVVALALDYRTFAGWVAKKKQTSNSATLAGSNSSPGEPVEPRDTSQPAQTC
jgi:hypothetical protein